MSITFYPISTKTLETVGIMTRSVWNYSINPKQNKTKQISYSI